uniref:Nucleoporin NUP53 n=1 Tax=Timema douglasi TaxID=61478 RepID=A0A7R8ZCT8_TIMDO|nr:unnamed protein product [Timema douglasi]
MVTNATRRLHRSSRRLFGQIYTGSRDCQFSYQRHEPTRRRIMASRMEPMTLDSPVGSPTSPYLPQFLLGDATTADKTAVSSSATTPATKTKHVSFGKVWTMDSPSSSHKNLADSHRERSSLPRASALKRTGPATQDLFEVASASKVEAPSSDPASVLRPAARSPGSVLWVTVFGFLPAMSSTILSHFSQLGTLVEYRVPPKGNWIHLKYGSPMECNKALSSNGLIVLENTMIGVVPCQDQEILEDCSDKENRIEPGTASSPAFLESRKRLRMSPYASSPGATSMRPLIQAYATARADSEVVSPAVVPHRSASVVSKVRELVFNW